MSPPSTPLFSHSFNYGNEFYLTYYVVYVLKESARGTVGWSFNLPKILLHRIIKFELGSSYVHLYIYFTIAEGEAFDGISINYTTMFLL